MPGASRTCFGASGCKNGNAVPYYVCSKRFNQHECGQDYVRAQLLEEANVEKEIARVESQVAKTQAAMDRYFEAFEAGTLQAELCNEKVRDLRARLEELENEKRALEARRGRLELPAIDREMLASLADEFERVMTRGTNPQKKDAIRRVVERVFVHDRRVFDVRYVLPNTRRFANWNKRLPR